MGYIIDPSKEGVGNSDYKQKDSNHKRSDYHHNLAYILEGLYQLEKSDGILWSIPSKDKKSHENI